MNKIIPEVSNRCSWLSLVCMRSLVYVYTNNYTVKFGVVYVSFFKEIHTSKSFFGAGIVIKSLFQANCEVLEHTISWTREQFTRKPLPQLAAEALSYMTEYVVYTTTSPGSFVN